MSYSEMTDQELNKLAAKMMDFGFNIFKSNNGDLILYGKIVWNPTHNIEQAVMCVDKLGWQIGIYKTQQNLWGVHLESPCDKFDILIKKKSMALAIVIACLKAEKLK